MQYAALTPSQQQQAQHDLFHDDLFAVDSTQFDYIVDASGLVTGRVAARLDRNHKPVRNQPITLVSTVASALDEDNRYRLDCAINDLARLVAVLLVASQKESEYVGQ